MLANPLIFNGGADRDRTDDLLNAIQALSQLSYSPYLKTITNYQITIIKQLRNYFRMKIVNCKMKN